MTHQIDHAAAMKWAREQLSACDNQCFDCNAARAYLAHAETIRELQARVKRLEDSIAGDRLAKRISKRVLVQPCVPYTSEFADLICGIRYATASRLMNDADDILQQRERRKQIMEDDKS